jgi:uncharacterized protein DUF2344
VQRLEAGAAPLSRCIDLGEYRAWINPARRQLTPELFLALDALPFHDAAWQEERLQALLGRASLVVTRADKEGKSLDIRPFIRDLRYAADRGTVEMWLRLGSQGQARPQEVLEALYGVPGACFRLRRERIGAEQDIAPGLPALVPA